MVTITFYNLTSATKKATRRRGPSTEPTNEKEVRSNKVRERPCQEVSTRDVGGTVDSGSALRSAGILLLRVRAPPPTLRSNGWPENLRSHFSGLATHKHRTKANEYTNILAIPRSTFCHLYAQLGEDLQD
ncbi:hypothetical protein PoB_003426500 [Plakobranchus ocellatus]|uniref:Uncharacterized protein n=1 Tax=Plakobranchus ocellatus TaxID=259542 RepID=A0AAV4AK81_9GAST|nr:hypothetical protein PoB_003426500 [Plakobranchus ocellatus]